MTLLTETMAAAATAAQTPTDLTQSQAPNDRVDKDGTKVIMRGIITFPSVPEYKWFGWLWANKEDRAAWWKVVTQGPSDLEVRPKWWWLRAYTGTALTFLLTTTAIVRRNDTSTMPKMMAAYALYFGGYYGEVCWRVLWMERCLAMYTGVFTFSAPQELNDLQEEEGDEDTINNEKGDASDTTGHAKTE